MTMETEVASDSNASDTALCATPCPATCAAPCPAPCLARKRPTLSAAQTRGRCTNSEIDPEAFREGIAKIICLRARRNAGDASYVGGGIWLGSVGDSKNVARLEKNGITHILTVAAGLHLPPGSPFETLCFPALDNVQYPIAEIFEESFAFIDKGRSAGGVLVHCYAGRSRSPTIVVGYLMTRLRWTFSSSIEFVRRQRPFIQLNPGFSCALYKLHTQLAAVCPLHDADPDELESLPPGAAPLFVPCLPCAAVEGELVPCAPASGPPASGASPLAPPAYQIDELQ